MKDIKVVFMGTPIFAKNILEGLVKEYNVVLVVSQPDKEKDRKGNIIETPTKTLAKESNIDVFQPEKVRENYQKILSYNPDIIVTCAYGQIIPKEILDYPKYGCINVHGSLLPKLRGGAPIHRAIINGDKETGITIMYMSEKMDAGDIISQQKMLIEFDDNLDKVYEKMSYLGRNLLLKTLPAILNGTNERITQDQKEVSFGYNITKEEEKINFDKLAMEVYNHIRGLSTIPGSYALLDGKRLKVYSSKLLKQSKTGEVGEIVAINKEGIIVNCRDKQIALTDIKLEGKKRYLVKDFINGIKIEDYIGKVLK